jgi:hypothetical protein
VQTADTVEKAKRITYCGCVFVALGIQHAERVRHVVCGLYGSTLFFSHYLINGTIFGGKIFEHEICVLIFSTVLV